MTKVKNDKWMPPLFQNFKAIAAAIMRHQICGKPGEPTGQWSVQYDDKLKFPIVTLSGSLPSTLTLKSLNGNVCEMSPQGVASAVSICAMSWLNLATHPHAEEYRLPKEAIQDLKFADDAEKEAVGKLAHTLYGEMQRSHSFTNAKPTAAEREFNLSREDSKLIWRFLD